MTRKVDPAAGDPAAGAPAAGVFRGNSDAANPQQNARRALSVVSVIEI
jgi:hypothetical protein